MTKISWLGDDGKERKLVIDKEQNFIGYKGFAKDFQTTDNIIVDGIVQRPIKMMADRLTNDLRVLHKDLGLDSHWHDLGVEETKPDEN